MSRDEMLAAERMFAQSDIYRRVRVYTRTLSPEVAKTNICVLPREMFDALEAAAPFWMRFMTPSGDLTFGLFGWHFREETTSHAV